MAVAKSIEQQQNRGAGDGYGTVGNMDMLGADEAGDDQSKNKQRFSQQFPVSNGIFFADAHNGLFVFFGREKAFVPDEVESENQNNHGYGNNRCQFVNEIHKGQLQRRADKNVRRIADEGCRSADVGSEDFQNQIGIGVDFKFAGNLEGNRRNQQNRGNVVQKGRENRSYKGQHNQQAAGIGADFFGAPDGYKLEHTRFLGNADNRHHADQKRNSVEIDTLKGGFLCQNTRKNHQRRTQKGDNGAIEFFGKQDCIADNDNGRCYNFGVHAPD